MVQEIRQVVLDKEELVCALEGHRRMTPGFLPAGTIMDYKIVGYDGIMVSLSDPATGFSEIILDESKLLKPVIRFCIENNIMLPRDGRKSISVGDENVSLCINLDVETYMSGTMEPLRLAAVGARA